MTESYHILKGLGEIYIFHWPVSGFGQYCTDIETAKMEFESTIIEDPLNSYKLISYPTVTDYSNPEKIIGIIGNQTIIKEYHPKKQ